MIITYASQAHIFQSDIMVPNDKELLLKGDGL
jgi:hypothetical protein